MFSPFRDITQLDKLVLRILEHLKPHMLSTATLRVRLKNQDHSLTEMLDSDLLYHLFDMKIRCLIVDVKAQAKNNSSVICWRMPKSHIESLYGSESAQYLHGDFPVKIPKILWL